MERELDVIVIRTDVKRTATEEKAMDTLLKLYEDRKGYTIVKNESKTIVYKTVKE